VLGVGGAAAVGGADCPAVLVEVDLVRAAGDEPGLDRDDQAGDEAQATSGPAPVGDVRVLVHAAADAVAAEVGGDAVPGGAADLADRGGDVAEPAARPRRGDSRRERRFCRGDKRRVTVGRCPDGKGDRGVTDPAVQRRAGVDAEQVAVAEPVVVGDAVQRGVVDRRADDRRVRDRRELRVVVQERRGGPGLGENLPGGRVEFLERHARCGDGTRRREDVGDDTPGGTDRVNLPRRLDLDHSCLRPALVATSRPGAWGVVPREKIVC
jgi:hypothetical protein